MNRRTVISSVFSLAVVLMALPASAQDLTLWRFLGIPQGMNKIHAQMFNRRGNFPGLEKKPPLKALADPANLESPIEAIKVGAEVKIQEDLAPQKIKAVKFLAEHACGCYNDKMEGAVVDALVKSMDDCTEKVRLKTVEAIQGSAEGQCCDNCDQKCCCDPKILKQLAKMAFERDEFGCYAEPSERVREAALEALQTCCTGDTPPIVEGEIETTPKIEGTDPMTPKIEGTQTKTTPQQYYPGAAPATRSIIDPPPAPRVQDISVPATKIPMKSKSGDVPSERLERTASSKGTKGSLSSFIKTTPKAAAAPVRKASRKIDSKDQAAKILIDLEGNLAQVSFDQGGKLNIGQKLRVYEKKSYGYRLLGHLEVVEAAGNRANVRPVSGFELSRIGQGSIVVK